MKKVIILTAIVFVTLNSIAQDFNGSISTAKASYKAGKLEDTHFALQQALQEIDMIIGKEVMKLLPVKMDTLSNNPFDDNVSSNAGFIGATVHRSYGKYGKRADLSIISNSPMVNMLNSFLNNPMMAGNDGNSKNMKVQGYKARLERRTTDTEGKYNYELQVPLGNALITFTVDNSTEVEITTMVNTIPLAQIAKLIQ
jgi:hypothetical protein